MVTIVRIVMLMVRMEMKGLRESSQNKTKIIPGRVIRYSRQMRKKNLKHLLFMN